MLVAAAHVLGFRELALGWVTSAPCVLARVWMVGEHWSRTRVGFVRVIRPCGLFVTCMSCLDLMVCVCAPWVWLRASEPALGAPDASPASRRDSLLAGGELSHGCHGTGAQSYAPGVPAIWLQAPHTSPPLLCAPRGTRTRVHVLSYRCIVLALVLCSVLNSCGPSASILCVCDGVQTSSGHSAVWNLYGSSIVAPRWWASWTSAVRTTRTRRASAPRATCSIAGNPRLASE